MALIRTNTNVINIQATHDDITGFTADISKKFVRIFLVHGNMIENIFVPVYRDTYMIQDTPEVKKEISEFLSVKTNSITLTYSPSNDTISLSVQGEPIGKDAFIIDKNVLTFNADATYEDGVQLRIEYKYILEAASIDWQNAAMATVTPNVSLFENLKETLWGLLISNGYVAGKII